jgi:hypothetical protein
MTLPAQNVREIAPHNLHRSINAAVSLRQELARLITGEAGGDMTPDDLEALRDTFDGQTTLDAEIRRAVLAIEEDEILIAGMKARETELKNRRLRIEKRIEATRGLIEQAMTLPNGPSTRWTSEQSRSARPRRALRSTTKARSPASFGSLPIRRSTRRG